MLYISAVGSSFLIFLSSKVQQSPSVHYVGFHCTELLNSLKVIHTDVFIYDMYILYIYTV